MLKNLKILIIGKSEDPQLRTIYEYCKMHFSHVEVVESDWGKPIPQGLYEWKGDLIISYLSRWILPQEILDLAKICAINFHPAPPEYPGVGCTNFALYDEVKTYGVTCHKMVAKVDTGQIIAVKRFDVLAEDNVESLLDKSYAALKTLFFEVMGDFIKRSEFNSANEKWSNICRNRKDLNNLSVITPDMSADEIQKRFRATSFKNWKPVLKLNGLLIKIDSIKRKN